MWPEPLARWVTPPKVDLSVTIPGKVDRSHTHGADRRAS